MIECVRKMIAEHEAGTHDKPDIGGNVERVQKRIAAACERSGRTAQEVTLLAVSKTMAPERIRRAYDAGLRHFGENRVQEAQAKRPALSDLDITWHLVGHLQTNKVKQAVSLFQWIHSVDSFRVAETLHNSAPSGGSRLPVLIEVNLANEVAKSGVDESTTLALAQQVMMLGNLELRGLMAVPPFFENPEATRPFFQRLRVLRDNTAAGLEKVALPDLSMGMSHDFEVAIEEGATIVRVGTAIFGAR